MALKLEIYEGSDQLEDIGTLEDAVGSEGTITFLKKNFMSDKRVVVLAKNKDNESAIVTCSKQLSDHLRKSKADGATKEELLAYVASLSILENAEGTPYITVPSSGEVTEGIKIRDLKKKKVSDKVKVIADLDEVPWF